jgi:ABC-2 type transport system ATP-binding protein
MPSAVTVRGLTKRFGSVVAVRDAGFAVEAGEIFGLIGPNGAGKTTVLECILGLSRPEAGEIFVRGIDARAQPARAREKLGAQLQSSALPDAMTPRQALKLCAAFFARPAEAPALLRQFGLEDKAGARYGTLSMGQKQRLALALAFVNQPEVVILDEPTASLDPTARRELHALIAAQRAAGRAIVFTTHYLEEARTLCDRVAFMAAGRLVAVGTPQNLIAQSRTPDRLVVRTAPLVPAAAVRALPGVGRATAAAGTWTLETSALNSTLAAFSAAAAVLGAEVEEIQILRPTLDDAFEKLSALGEPDAFDPTASESAGFR